jgi:hypothetical protein
MRKSIAEGNEGEVDGAVSRLRQRIEHWRSGREIGKRMPERLWRAAREVAREHGLAPTSRLLKLDYYTLKKRLEAVVIAKPAFIELGRLPNAGGQGEWSIEVEEQRGRKVRVQYKGPQAPDLGLLGSSLWRAGK